RIQRHPVACGSRASLRTASIGLRFAAAAPCRHQDQGCRSPAPRRPSILFAAALRATVPPGETPTVMMDPCCRATEACSTRPLKHGAVVIGGHLNAVAELEAARLDGRDGLFGGHPQLSCWPSRLSQDGRFLARSRVPTHDGE